MKIIPSMSSTQRIILTEQIKRDLICGNLTMTGDEKGPLVVRKTKESYLKFDGIRIEKNKRGGMRLWLLFRTRDLGYWELPQCAEGDSVTIQSQDAIQGRSPLVVT